MKRKFRSGEGGGDSDVSSFYTVPNLESTMMVDTGGGPGGNTTYCLGKIPAIPINASLSSGAELFQYNRFYWNNDLFTFNYTNCAIYLAIAYYPGGSDQKVSFVFYPIFLPRSVMTDYQSISASNMTTDNPKKRKYLIDSILYYLNGAFTSFGFDAATPPSTPPPGIQWPPNGPLSTGPSLYASYLKGFLERPIGDKPNFPIFQDAAKEPPLKFVYVSSNNQIALVKNPAFWDNHGNYSPGASIAFQFVSPESFVMTGLNNPSTNIADHNGGSPKPPPPPLVDVFVPSVFSGSSSSSGLTGGSEKGWCTQGVYGLGFSLGRSTVNPTQFSDVYNGSSDERVALFAQTNWPGDSFLLKSSTFEFEKWAVENKLSTSMIIAPKICSLLPSRFIVCKSETLTRTQKVMALSNNPSIGSNPTMSLQYLDLDNLKTRIDSTDRKGTSRLSDSVTHLIPSFSIQSLDIQVQDEWGNYIQNFRNPTGYNMNFDPSPISAGVFGEGVGNFIFLLEGEVAFGNGVYETPPPWLAVYNPSPIVGNTSPLIAPFSTYLSQPFYGLFARIASSAPPPNGKKMLIPPDFTPNIPYSGNIIHFGRVLGN